MEAGTLTTTSLKVLVALLIAGLLAIVAQTAVAQMPADTKFIDAIRDRDYSESLSYLVGGGSPDVRDYHGVPAIVVAAIIGDGGMVRRLLESGANPNLADRESGNTAMISSAARGSDVIIRLLVYFDADINLENSSGQTALMRAIQESQINAIKALLEAGADIEQADYTGQNAYDYSLKSRNRRVKSIIHAAVYGS